MRYIIKNTELTVEIESLGAEIKSVKRNSTKLEYMWQADPTYWNRTSPVLFPFVGSVVNDTYEFDNKTYHITQHGFARDSEFEVLSQDEASISFCLKDSEGTYEKYPFHFELLVGYQLVQDTLQVIWTVKNPGQNRKDENLYFSIGGHPAFNCPINGAVSKTGYKLYFENANKLQHHGNLNGTCTKEDISLYLENNRAVISEDFFDRSTYMVENNQAHLVALETPDGKPYITVKFDAPLFGIWSPIKKDAPFICIEPWYGRADYDDYQGDLVNREYENVLSKNETWTRSYSITYGTV